jgi:hypothetical protein
MHSQVRALAVVALALAIAVAPAAGAAGALEWSHTRHSSDVVAVDTGQGLAVSADSGEIQADAVGTGTQQWATSLLSVNDVAVGNSDIFVANGTELQRLRPSDGSVTATQVSVGGNDWEHVAAADGGVVAVESNGFVRLYDTDFSQQDTYNGLSAVETAAIDNRHIYLAAPDGTVVALNRQDEQDISTAWSRNQTFDSIAAIDSNGETVAVAGTDGNGDPVVAVYDRVTGALRWTHSHHSASVQSVGINDGHVASGDSGGSVYTARLSDGAQVDLHNWHSGGVSGLSMTDNLTVSGDTSSDNEVLAVEQPARLSNPDPTDGRPTPPTTLSVDVTDPGSQDTFTVTFYNQSSGNVIGTDTVTGDGTASVSWDHNATTTSTWNATLTDGNGDEVDSTGDITFNAPQTLIIREELPPHQRITTTTNVTIRFFGDNETIYEREVSDGSLDLSGLPDQPFVAVIQPPNSSDYTRRATYFRTTYARQTAFLLDTNETTTIESRFVLDDQTGEYATDSILYIERPINLSGDLRWRTIAADQFGAEGVTVTLEEDRRYRVRVRSQDGQTQVVGPYRSDVSETVDVRPGAPTIELGEPIDGWYANATLDGQTLEYRFSDPSNLTDEVNISIYERGNKSNTLQPDESYQDLGSVAKQTTLTQSESEKEWVVVFNVTRDGQEYTKRVYVRNGPDLVPGPVTREWRLIGAVLMLLISAGAFSVLNAGVGAVVVSIEGAVLYWTGWLQGATSAAAVVIALFMAIVVHIYRASGP